MEHIKSGDAVDIAAKELDIDGDHLEVLPCDSLMRLGDEPFGRGFLVRETEALVRAEKRDFRRAVYVSIGGEVLAVNKRD